MVFTALRFVQGLLMNITGLLKIYVTEQMPPGRGKSSACPAQHHLQPGYNFYVPGHVVDLHS